MKRPRNGRGPRARRRAPRRSSRRSLWRWLRPATKTPRVDDPHLRQRTINRGRWIGGAVAACYLGLSLQAGLIMLTPDEKLESRAQTLFEQSIQIEGRRGEILARDGEILATTADLMSVYADPSKLNEQTAKQVADVLAPLIDQPPAAIRKRLLDNPERRSLSLERGLTPIAADAIRDARRELVRSDRSMVGSIWMEPEPRRFYPGKSHAAPVIGIVDHKGGGVVGLERTMDRVLRGEVRKYVQWRDRKGRRVTPDMPTAAPGDSIVLTLDRQLQHVTEGALDEAVERTGAESAWAVVMDVQTGEILALANRPTHNPNDTSTLNLKSFKNRAALDAYEPGSVFKPFVAAAALEEGLVRPQSMVDCEMGRWRIGRTTIHDDHPKGVISVSEVIKYSSNIGAAKLAFQLGAERTLGYLHDLGFGRYSGLNLPGETRGAMQRPERIKPIELATTSYGHGVSVNAIQLAGALATLGNDGVRMEPRLVREIRGPDGGVLESFEPTVDRRVFSPETAKATLDMMITVTEEGGTGTRARVPGFVVAGKTGTAWKHINGGYSSTARIGSFVGVIPAEDPKLAVVVTVDTPTKGSSYGGIVAAPAFATIAREGMRIYGIDPDPILLEAHKEAERRRKRLPPPKPRPAPQAPVVLSPEAPPELVWAGEGALIAPDLTGLSMRDALAALEGAGLHLSMTGSGRIVTQQPSPGTALAVGESVEVVLQ
ncbi:MAG: penicillin-binding protein [Myxococcota bacterium]